MSPTYHLKVPFKSGSQILRHPIRKIRVPNGFFDQLTDVCLRMNLLDISGVLDVEFSTASRPVRLPSLRLLDVDALQQDASRMVNLDLSLCTNLEVVKVSRQNVTGLPASLKAFSERALEPADISRDRYPPITSVLSRCLQLECLELFHSGTSGSDIANLLKCRIQLKRFAIGPSSVFDDQGLQALGRRCDRLASLELIKCASVTGDALIRLVSKMMDPQTGKAALDLLLEDCPFRRVALFRVFHSPAQMAAVTPLVNSAMLTDYVGRTVRLVGRRIKLEGDVALLEATDHGQVTVRLNRDSHWADDYVMVIAKVDEAPNSVKELASFNRGATLDLDTFDKMIRVCKMLPECFPTS
ncbi:uncharacterized protein L969DRAFT_46373 [Mixia osmundae IAM 14324]|uniref:Uncharacterized protein n=1 Tax=Mixia osmundae (strain CBS 9802 / IAM 14324 / JCM 22182 / KY 12970) TaxID=764103 RepID=G7E5F5_MIXOS|nr:uncharacterized protein L969DRAFT_46373 [Mixia osmundae IAM 14324]KEI40784.1 hypothetical protein L969DRAFT_46373 [Mixia osmundae IAM 14324]GAA98065.1 hypothetical protein E5Q_04746 [Mixia osmundae IAM 14324]